MKASLLAIRAITAEYAWQLIRPFVWVGVAVVAILLIIIGLLAALYSPWWWLLALPVVSVAAVGLVLWLAVRRILHTISPLLSPAQVTSTRQFVAKTKRLSETIHTPYPVILFHLVKDLLTRRNQGYIYGLTQDSKTLHKDFLAVRQEFENEKINKGNDGR